MVSNSIWFETNFQRGAQHELYARVDSETSKQIYSHRMSVVEPVFGDIGTNKGLKRFSLHGKTKVRDQWQLFFMVHNLEKVSRYSKVRVELGEEWPKPDNSAPTEAN